MKKTSTKTTRKAVIASTFILCGIILLFSCKKTEDLIPDEPTSGIPGMGKTNGELQGTAFHLPTGIEIIGTLKGYEFDTIPCQEAGYGFYVNIGMKLVNHGPDTMLVLPAGLTFKSLSDEDQNGIIVQKQRLHLSIGDTCFVAIGAFCLNLYRHGSDGDSRFEIGPVTNAEPMQELINLLENKNIINDAYAVQDFVWQVSDFGGLTDNDRTAIGHLPNK